MNFYPMSMNGEHLLRIMNQYDPNHKQITNIRTEIRNLENIQYYCKHNRLPEKKEVLVFQKKFKMKLKKAMGTELSLSIGLLGQELI